MRLLFCGDVVGRSGRKAIEEHIENIKRAHKIDCVIVNGENAASGFGMTAKICDDFFAAGADILTGGDHIWDQQEMMSYVSQHSRVLRPHNFPSSAPGSGLYEYTTFGGATVVVLHLLGQVFFRTPVDCPFACAEKALQPYRLGRNAQAIFVDFHAEATSEKMAMGHFLDGRVSAVVGSHTHVPTADAQVLPGGTAYQTDAGMCGDYHSVIGMEKEAPLTRFTSKIHKLRMQPARGEATLCGVLVEVDDATGLATAITPLRMGGVLSPSGVPVV